MAIDVFSYNSFAFFLQNNLVQNNIGGLLVRADSRGSATSLRGWIHNNLFFANHERPCLKVEGKNFHPSFMTSMQVS